MARNCTVETKGSAWLFILQRASDLCSESQPRKRHMTASVRLVALQFGEDVRNLPLHRAVAMVNCTPIALLSKTFTAASPAQPRIQFTLSERFYWRLLGALE